MALPLLAIGLGLAQMLAPSIPGIVAKVAGNEAGDLAAKLANIAQAVTGTAGPQEALGVLQADPSKQLEYLSAVLRSDDDRLKVGAATVQVEMASSWLGANWRPITMLLFVALIVARWLGWTAPGMTEAEYLSVYDLIKIGLGGYVVGRSLEKMAPTFATAFTGRR